MFSNSPLKIAIVTGCAGFIGSALTTKLLLSGWFVYGIDKLTYAANHGALTKLRENTNFKFIHEDIAVLTHLPDCDVVFNLAAESDVDTSNIKPQEFIHSNIKGVQNLLELITQKTLKKDAPELVHVSTDEVYGSIDIGSFTEESELNPTNPYAATKAAADLLIKSWSNLYDLKYKIVRPSNTYGINQHVEKLIPLSIKQLVRGKRIKLHNHGTPVRTWTSVADTITGIITVHEKGSHKEIYNISSEFEQANIVTVTNILKNFDSDLKLSECVDFSYSRPAQDMRYAISAAKIKNLGWQAKNNINTDLPGLVTWYKCRSIE